MAHEDSAADCATLLLQYDHIYLKIFTLTSSRTQTDSLYIFAA